ncbi:hypothetical protein FLCU109888_11690 [Flavobacterium cucumis]|uniref:Uncharacterized protein n=1 Tax=Flavobacterium cucumis TaxID=416016 RepID=A0A1M7ZVL3_9FLAO|nr:hypothetical protein [Flavobacterium cucumis]SHO72912.1 hypothetical protein SAMN05443547_1258 [Flavobacterium cucumis]
MKKILLLYLFTFVSCGIPYDGEAIINIKLKVVNVENEPLENEKAYVFTSYGDDSFDTSTYKKVSNNEGFINFKMFKPQNSASLILEESNEYLPVTFYGLNDDNFTESDWELGTLILFKIDEIISFTIQLNQISSNKILEKIEVIAIKYQPQINLNEENNTDYFDPELYYLIKKNQSIELKYQTRNTITNEIEYYTIPLVINDTEIQYTLTY